MTTLSSPFLAASMTRAQGKPRRSPALIAQARSARVIILSGIIVVLSMADLYLTLLFLRSVGMGEANPLARHIILNFPPAVLIAWKCCSVALTVLILVRLRRRCSAEIGAWLCTLVLCALTAHWTHYTASLQCLTPVLHHLADSPCAQWVRLHEPPRPGA